MDGNTQKAQAAAFEMTNGSTEDLRRELITAGIYETLIEGGFHMETLTDAEADHLATLIARDGIRGLAAYPDIRELVEQYVTVTFIPEVWSDDYAQASDDTITFYVPLTDALADGQTVDGFLASGEGLVESRSGDSDALKHHARAPLSVQKYPGPYSVIVEY